MNSLQFRNQIVSQTDQLFRLAKSILRKDEEARDAVQDLNIKLWEKRNMLDSVDNIKAFTFRSMRNLCLDIIRQRHFEDEISVDIINKEPDPHQRVESSDMMKRISQLIDELPELQRTVIRMRDVEEMEIGEIADILELTPNAVTVNLSRARKKIRDQIIQENKRVEEMICRK